MGLQEHDITDDVISLLDVITILLLEENPILGIVLVALLKTVTEDRLARISLILLVIILGTTKSEQ
ncbi:hypothetical protein [Domibacillus epiphyticus]|uniref:Uncharacterized protein n=1 Tax=Domibacillus epiphyticus TaxID=1714355 RepID=A0A1V2A7Y9_9BACI|nr:hypothetical protein [Domibacillus epiphyticus]OMP67050.1 hypothetical protein BTO28_08680 [Domibacillus epiphyticus]